MGPDAVLRTTPEQSEVLAGGYESLASCSYEAIEKTGETGLRKADLPASKTSKIVLDPWREIRNGTDRKEKTNRPKP
jgi:hypothetical protein